MEKFVTKEGCKATEIHNRMCIVMGEDAPSFSTVCRWSLQFKQGRKSLDDEPRSDRPSEVTQPEVIAAIEKGILADRRVKVSELSLEFQITVGSVEKIIHDHLGMCKVSARWVPRNLSAQDRHQRTQSCTELLDLYNADEARFLSCLVTGDETWIHHWDRETKLKSLQWKHPSSPPQ
ncbi:histone-lysine N-methyltransferase SETMAR-like [Haliotis asinina]|uniref:histone-lysine N-methyltransferase SETMAR-like n=1 Tax=Haliotis asinina TaxID=109174 RepID=UPI003531C709